MRKIRALRIYIYNVKAMCIFVHFHARVGEVLFFIWGRVNAHL